MDDNNNSTIDTSSSSSSSSSSITLPIIEANEKLLSSISTNIPITSSDVDEKVMIINEEQENETSQENLNNKKSIDNSSHLTNLDINEKFSPLTEYHSPQTIISTILDTVITKIESIIDDNQFNVLPIIEDEQC